MKIRVLSYNRRIHVPATSRLAVAGALGMAGLGALAGGCGIVLAARDNADARPAVEAEALVRVDTTSVPPTMVLLPTTTTSAPPARMPDADRELGFVLRGLYSAVLLASGPVADIEHPGLRAYATGEALREVQEAIAARAAEGLALRPSRTGAASSLRIVAAEIGTDRATATACETESHEMYDVATGDTIDDEIVVSELRVVFVREGGGWKVAKVEFSREPAPGCATPSS